MMKRPVASLLIAAATLALVACTPAAKPSPSKVPYSAPAIVGDTVSASPLEQDPMVIAARAGLLGLVLAQNAADFSIEPFVSTSTGPAQRRAYRNFLLDAVDPGHPQVPTPGPRVLLPLSIDVLGETTIVWFCEAREYWTAEDPATLTQGRVTAADVVTIDGDILMSDHGGIGDACDATGAPIARFDPVPQSLGILTKADVVPPPNEK